MTVTIDLFYNLQYMQKLCAYKFILSYTSTKKQFEVYEIPK